MLLLFLILVNWRADLSDSISPHDSVEEVLEKGQPSGSDLSSFLEIKEFRATPEREPFRRWRSAERYRAGISGASGEALDSSSPTNPETST
jgi:hypothetical protein